MNQKILIDIVHPADVLFFHHPIRLLQQAGIEIVVASRDKDKTTELLAELGHTQHCLSTAGRGLTGLASELCQRDWNLLKLARQIKPDLLCGFGAVAPAHVGTLLRIPAISFYDTEEARLQQWLSEPFLHRIYVPRTYKKKTARKKTRHFPGIKELSYFHPANFSADAERARQAGLQPERRNFFLRRVGWHANHDLGKSGWSDELCEHLITQLSEIGVVHLSSEERLPVHLQTYCVNARATDMHHLLAHCDLYIGESATMAAEAAVMGVPTVYLAEDYRGYIDWLESSGLLKSSVPDNFEKTAAMIDSQLNSNRESYLSNHRAWLARSENLAEFVCEELLACLDKSRDRDPEVHV